MISPRPVPVSGAHADVNGSVNTDPSGSQAPLGTYFAVPLHFYTADQINDQDGNALRRGAQLVLGPALNVVTTKKIAGANYGFLVALPWANNRVQGANDFDSNPGAGAGVPIRDLQQTQCRDRPLMRAILTIACAT